MSMGFIYALVPILAGVILLVVASTAIKDDKSKSLNPFSHKSTKGRLNIAGTVILGVGVLLAGFMVWGGAKDVNRSIGVMERMLERSRAQRYY